MSADNAWRKQQAENEYNARILERLYTRKTGEILQSGNRTRVRFLGNWLMKQDNIYLKPGYTIGILKALLTLWKDVNKLMNAGGTDESYEDLVSSQIRLINIAIEQKEKREHGG